MDLFPHTFVGTVTLVTSLMSLVFFLLGLMSKALAPHPIIEPEPEILDPLEEEFRALEEKVWNREETRELSELAKFRREVSQIVARNGPCQHKRLRITLAGPTVFLCRDCGQVVKTRAKALE